MARKGTAKKKNEETTDGSEEKNGQLKLPPHPLHRDVCLGDTTHRGTMLLNDLIRIHYFLLKGDKTVKVYTTEEEASALAARLTSLFLQGKQLELSGLKDVPEPFLIGEGRFFDKSGDSWVQKTEEEAKSLVAKAIIEQFEAMEAGTLPNELEEAVATLTHNCDPATKGPEDPSSFSAPRTCDVLFLPIDHDWDESLPYEHQSGNKHLLFLASLNVAADTNETEKRVETAFKIVTSKVEVNSGTELVPKTPRYIAQEPVPTELHKWRELSKDELAELACLFTFEVFLAKQRLGFGLPNSAPGSKGVVEMVKPSEFPVDDPMPHDVLFGRGGMTNGHAGNRRFRDIIALHRPDYIRANKMDKPNVARRIVRAFRQGNPPGRFLKKQDDGKWYDVGDRTAAEKTSQGLRERSNAEKRQRSALREALKIRKVDLVDRIAGRSPAKKAKIDVTSESYNLLGVHHYTSSIPMSLSMKKTTDEPYSDEDSEVSVAEPLPPNAVDKDGNILVTDYDILCGRGGLTNHHRGNKRFRDIVALHRPDYVRAPKIQKPSVARVIVRAIRNGEPPGRFLKKDEKTKKWVDIGDRKAAEKTSQALREKPEDEQRGSVQSPAALAPKKSEDDKGDSKTPAFKEEKTDAGILMEV